jgi:MFS transporter, DHA3 family, macrolide efflux protein
LKESLFGFYYIFKRKSLFGLQLVFLAGNFFALIAHILYAPMILSRTENNALIFGSVQTAGAVGGLVGGLLISVWGGPNRKAYGVLGGWALSGIFGTILFGLGTTLVVWMIGSFMGGLFVPLMNSSNQSIWQSKVEPDIQGRVFAIRRLIAWLVNPLAMLIAGPTADFIMEPAMQPDGWLAKTFGWLVGVGPGAGMALLIIAGGIGMVLVGIAGLSVPQIRNVEAIMPDHKAEVADETVKGTAQYEAVPEDGADS